MAVIEKLSDGEDVEKRELRTVGGTANWHGHYGKQYESPQKVKTITTTSSRKSTSGIISQENENIM